MLSPRPDRRQQSKAGTNSGKRKRLHKIPSTTWRERIAARKDSVKEDIENALGHHKSKRGKTVEARMARTREKIISEIFCSEKTYQEQLKIVIQQFMMPMQKLGLLPDPDHKIIFENIKSIQAVNLELLTYMEEKGIPQAFIELAPFLKVYCTFANNYERSMQTLQDWERKHAEFGDFLRLQESKPNVCCLNLHSLLITPIQRVPRYRLLLSELLDNTPEDHIDYKQLQEAVSAITKVTAGINEYIKEHENFQKMLIIQNSLTGANAPRILAPGRRFLKEGVLMKVSKKGNGSNERMFFLFNDMLVYAKPNLLDQTHTSRTYASRRIICLDRCEVQLVLGEHKVTGAGALFKIVFDGDYLLLYSIENSNALSWVSTLQGAILQLKENRVTLRRTSLRLRSTSRSGKSRRSVLRSSFSLRNKLQYPEDDQISSDKAPRDILYPMRTMILRRKQSTPSCNPPVKKESKKKLRRLERGPFSSKRKQRARHYEPNHSETDSNPTSTTTHLPTQDKATPTNIHIPPTVPLFDVMDTGSEFEGRDITFCVLV